MGSSGIIKESVKNNGLATLGFIEVGFATPIPTASHDCSTIPALF